MSDILQIGFRPWTNSLAPEQLASVAAGLDMTLGEANIQAHTILAYDSFDWRLWNSQYLLLQVSQHTFLVDREAGSTRCDCKAKLPAGDVCENHFPKRMRKILMPILHPRVVYPRQEMLYQFSRQEVRDDEQKLIGHLLIFTGETKNGGRKFNACAVEALRGYQLEAAKLCDSLTTQSTTGNLAQLFIGDLVAQQATAGYSSKPVLEFSRESASAPVLRDYLLCNLQIVKSNIDGTIADRDPEFLHDYRVALRRSRALLALLKKVFGNAQSGQLRQQLKLLASPTNRLRDLDVWLLEADDYRKLLPEEFHEGFAELLLVLQRQRRNALAAVRRHLRNEQSRDMLDSMRREIESIDVKTSGPWAQQSCLDSARKVFHKHSQHTSQLCKAIHGHSADDEVHALRIECKKLRYLAEFYKPIAQPDHWKQVTRSLKELQDCLGHFNDLSVQRDFLLQEVLSSDKTEPLEPTATLAAGGLCSAIHSQLNDEKKQVINTLRSFVHRLDQLPLEQLFSSGENTAKEHN